MSLEQQVQVIGSHESVISLNNFEIARQIELRPRKATSIFKKTPVNQRGAVLLLLPKKNRIAILKRLAQPEIIKFLHYLDLDGAGEIIEAVDKQRRIAISNELGDDLKLKIASLTKLDPNRIEQLMDLNYIQVDQKMTIDKIASIIKQYEKKTGRFPTILIMNDGHLLGSLPGHALAVIQDEDTLSTHIREIATVKYTDGPAEIIEAFKRSQYDKLVVLNDDDSVLGIIYSEEIIGLLERETAKKLYNFAGLNQSEDIEDSFKTKVAHRYRWLVLNLFTAFLASFVVSMYEDTISKLVLLAAYMPVVAGMGGNAATQTLAVVVRGLAVKNIKSKSILKIVSNEMLAGFFNGLITAIIILCLALIFGQGYLLGVVAGIAVIINLLIAGFFGTIVPFIMQKLNKDPATSATIFITTATDVFGFMVFLGLAKLVF